VNSKKEQIVFSDEIRANKWILNKKVFFQKHKTMKVKSFVCSENKSKIIALEEAEFETFSEILLFDCFN
jgi:hypothetical protein